VTLKTGLGIYQGNWKCHHAIERIRLPIDVLYQVINYASYRFVSKIFIVQKNVATLKSG